MKNASFLMLLCIILCFLPIFWLQSPKFEEKISGTVTVYNHLTGEISDMNLEEYTSRCMSAEMPESFHKEALKAQAVAIRSYTLSKKITDEHKDAKVCTDFNHCMAFLQEGEVGEAFLSAVKETENQVLLFDGKIANTVFHAMSSGKTENAHDVWGGFVPYLVSAECKGDMDNEKYKTEVNISWNEAFLKLGISEKVVGKTEKSEGGGVKKIVLGGKEFSGSEIRNAFNLRSSAFDVAEMKDGLLFTVYGYGHGVGMSQYGADALARSGMTYKEILSHFYKDTELISIDFEA